MSTEVVQRQAQSLKNLLDKCKGEIEAALPRHLTPERMLRIAMTEARTNTDLLACTQSSFIGAIIRCSQLGLEPGSALGHAYLIPFWNKKIGAKEVQLIVGYRGFLDMAGRSQRTSHVMARPVFEGDEFEFEYGLNERLIHRPAPAESSGKLTHVYAVIHLKDGGKIFDVMTRHQVEAIRARSKSADSGPWITDYEAMAVKTVVRRAFKFAPASIEIQQAIGLDEAADRGEQFNGDFIETEGVTVPEEAAKPAAIVAALDKKSAAKPKVSKVEETKISATVILKGVHPEESTAPSAFDEMVPPPLITRTRGEIVSSIIDLNDSCGFTEGNLHLMAKRSFKKKDLSLLTDFELLQMEGELKFDLEKKQNDK